MKKSSLLSHTHLTQAWSIQAVNFSGSVPLPVVKSPCQWEPTRPLTTSNLLHKHPEPITINPTPGNSPTTGLHKNIPQHHRESYCPTNLSFLPHKSSELLNNYVLELGLFLKWRHQQQAATSVGAWALVEDGGVFVLVLTGTVSKQWN